jgi:transposase
MQGRKNYQEQLFTSFQLSDRVPQDNLYRRLKETLDLRFLYMATAKYYGKEGQKSIDPIVFFKLMLVGYLENQPSDRRIIATSSMRMDVLYFIGYNIDEELPWHSTLSRTRQLYEEDVFTELFKLVLKQCIDRGLVSGRRQAIDSVLVKANASMDSLEQKKILDDAAVYARELQESEQEESTEGIVKTLPAREKRQKRTNKNAASTTDPDSRMAVKPGKVTKLNYLSQVSVDTSSHVITHIEAFHADKRDSQCLDSMLENVSENLKASGLHLEDIIADTNYSSSEALESLEKRGIKGYIPNVGAYKTEREGFQYDKENDVYYCSQGKTLKLSGYRNNRGVTKVYLSTRADCKDCPLKDQCLGKSQQKMITNAIAKPLFDKMHQRINTSQGRRMMQVRKSTVEPVIGSLVEYFGMKKVNTKGIKLANKCVLLAGIAYNLKKLLKFNSKKFQMAAKAFNGSFQSFIACFYALLSTISHCRSWILINRQFELES